MGAFLIVLLLMFVGIPLSLLGLTFAPLLTVWLWVGAIMVFFGGWGGFALWAALSAAWLPLLQNDEPVDPRGADPAPK